MIGGSVNGTGALTVEVTRTGEDSYLSQVVKLVEQAGASKSRAQGLADKAAFVLTMIAIVVGVATLAVWLFLGARFAFALERMVTVMVITCPHALGLAVPLVVAMITALSARNGLLIRNRTPFENARNVDTVVFDKTGTLTMGQFGVTDVASFGDWSEDELLRKAASVEQNSEHTIAQGIVRKAREKELALLKIRGLRFAAGQRGPGDDRRAGGLHRQHAHPRRGRRRDRTNLGGSLSGRLRRARPSCSSSPTARSRA